MNASERMDPKAGPFCNLSQAYLRGLDLAARGYEPVFKNAARWNLELMGLATRRARAWLELPSRLAQCKTPQDLVGENLRYWQTAAHDYAEGARLLAVAAAAFALPGAKGAWVAKSSPSRDYITFAEAKPAAQDAPPRDRRAA
jgi:hypothetical protein